MHQPLDPSTDLRAAIDEQGAGFPFATELSLKPLADYWEELVGREKAVYGATAQQIRDWLREAPALLGPIAPPAAHVRCGARNTRRDTRDSRGSRPVASS